MKRLLTLLACLGTAGCHWNLDEPGTDPKPAQLYFPTGILMDPDGQHAYVSNGNADLKYGGGTVQMVDMTRFECTVARWRNKNQGAAAPDPKCGSEADLAARDQDAATARCRTDVLDPSILDCDETPFILQNSTVRVGNFAGSIIMRRFKDNDKERELYVAVRGDPSITKINVHLGNDPTKPGVLDCFDNPGAAWPGYDPATNTSTAPRGCDESRLVREYQCAGYPICTEGRDGDGKFVLPPEPFGMKLDEGTFSSGASYARLVVSHLSTGQVSLIDIGQGTPSIVFTSTAFFTPDSTGRHGAFQVASQEPGKADALWYLSSNIQPTLSLFRIAEANVITSVGSVGIGGFSNGNDVRDLVFSADGKRLFLTDNNPGALAVFDTSPTDTSAGQPSNQLLDVVPLCQEPSHIGVRRYDVPGAPGTPARTETEVAAVCFSSLQVMFIDPDRPLITANAITGLTGPDQIAYNFNSKDEPQFKDKDSKFANEHYIDPTNQVPWHRAYVTNYLDSTIASIDLDLNSPTRHRVVARLGFPQDGYNP